MVILASWTQDAGYVITVQHRGNLISVYKHNAELLKKVGTFVNAGDIISIVGNSGEMTDGPHLHFELWYNGNSLNPEEFVTF
jgi:murein DD-endopeptidase MepM/ murein hydrolase activator NlpD